MSKSYILENAKVRLEISEDGAQIYSFIYKGDGLERIWNGDPTYWKQRNPILFPMVSNTPDKVQIFKGKEYHMGNHGFARYSEFSFVSQSDDTLVLRLQDSAETYEKYYPYHFKLEVTYHLLGAKLEILYRIKNDDEEEMPFGFGLHPAFRCPIADDEKFEDYHIEFSSLENGEGYPYDLIKDHKIALDYKYFDVMPTLLYQNLNSSTFTLSNGKRGVKVSAVGYPYLAIWTPKAPFICIEPWMYRSSRDEVGIPFKDRSSVICLKPDKTFVCSYSIEAF